MKNLDLNQVSGLKWIPNGQSNLTGDLLQLFKDLDSMFLKLASKVEAQEHQFPPFIRAEELNKLDYFKSFPHLITFPTVLKSDDANLEKFIEGERCTPQGQVQLTEMDPVCNCLTPAACYHFYIHFQNQDLQSTQYLTTRAHCFRREKYYSPLQRQWAFNMREIVCIGSSDEVKSFVAQYRELVTQKFARLGLDINWEIATDPFFNPESNAKFIMQTLDPVKHEMIFNKELSIGSTNFHKNYFGETFNIKYRGETAFSACIAFGLERWIFAILTQFGADPKNWPLAEIKNV